MPAVSAKTKGKVERPFSYIRQDFFLGRSFRDLVDLNAQLVDWLDTVANVRLHGTTQRIVAEAFAAEQPELQALPDHRFDAVLKLERRVSHDGFVAIGSDPMAGDNLCEVGIQFGDDFIEWSVSFASKPYPDPCDVAKELASQSIANAK